MTSSGAKVEPRHVPHSEKCRDTGRLGTKFEESLDQQGNSLCGMWRTCSRLLSKRGRLVISLKFPPNGEDMATRWNSTLVPVLLTECALSCVFSEELDTSDSLFDQPDILFFTITIMEGLHFLGNRKSRRDDVGILSLLVQYKILHARWLLATRIEILLAKNVKVTPRSY